MTEDSPMFDVLGLGTVVVDHYLMMDGFPQVDTKTIAVDDHCQVGGPVPTALVFLSRLGVKTSFIGFWGTDLYGTNVGVDLERENVDFNHSLIHTEIQTGFAHVWVDQQTGARTLVCRRPELNFAAYTSDVGTWPTSRLLHLDGWPAQQALEAARSVKKRGGVVSLDAGNLKPGMRELIPNVDLLNCPMRFLNQYFDPGQKALSAQQQLECVQFFLSQGVRQVSVTDGANGATLYTANERNYQPAHTVKVVDTNGAGDVFTGGLLYGYINQWPADESLKFASAAAALKCSGRGNRQALPTLEQIQSLSGLAPKL